MALSRINPADEFTAAETGSILITNNGNFYLSISAGVLTVEGVNYFAVSPASPIGALLKGQKAGHQFSLNGKAYIIEKVI